MKKEILVFILALAIAAVNAAAQNKEVEVRDMSLSSKEIKKLAEKHIVNLKTNGVLVVRMPSLAAKKKALLKYMEDREIALEKVNKTDRIVQFHCKCMLEAFKKYYTFTEVYMIWDTVPTSNIVNKVPGSILNENCEEIPGSIIQANDKDLYFAVYTRSSYNIEVYQDRWLIMTEENEEIPYSEVFHIYYDSPFSKLTRIFNKDPENFTGVECIFADQVVQKINYRHYNYYDSLLERREKKEKKRKLREARKKRE